MENEQIPVVSKENKIDTIFVLFLHGHVRNRINKLHKRKNPMPNRRISIH